jgi:hypothetical protein
VLEREKDSTGRLNGPAEHSAGDSEEAPTARSWKSFARAAATSALAEIDAMPSIDVEFVFDIGDGTI